MTNCPAKYRNIGSESFGCKKKVTAEMLKQFCQNDAYLYQQIKDLWDATDPETRKRFFAPYWQDDSKSYGIGEMTLTGSTKDENANLDKVYHFFDSSILKYHMNFDVNDDKTTQEDLDVGGDKITHYWSEALIDYENSSLEIVHDEGGNALRPPITEETATYLGQTTTKGHYKKKAKITDKLGKAKKDAYCDGAYHDFKTNTYWYIGFNKDKNYNIKKKWKKNQDSTDIPTICRSQTFTAESTGYLSKVAFKMYGDKNSKSPLIVEIRETTKKGYPSKKVLARTEKKFTNNAPAMENFVFESKAKVKKGTRYAIVLRSPLSTYKNGYKIGGWASTCFNPANKIYKDGAYHKGDAFLSEDNGKTWMKYGKNDKTLWYKWGLHKPLDFAFETYVQPIVGKKKKTKKVWVNGTTVGKDIDYTYSFYHKGIYYLNFKPLKTNPLKSITINPTFNVSNSYADVRIQIYDKSIEVTGAKTVEFALASNQHDYDYSKAYLLDSEGNRTGTIVKPTDNDKSVYVTLDGRYFRGNGANGNFIECTKNDCKWVTIWDSSKEFGYYEFAKGVNQKILKMRVEYDLKYNCLSDIAVGSLTDEEKIGIYNDLNGKNILLGNITTVTKNGTSYNIPSGVPIPSISSLSVELHTRATTEAYSRMMFYKPTRDEFLGANIWAEVDAKGKLYGNADLRIDIIRDETATSRMYFYKATDVRLYEHIVNYSLLYGEEPHLNETSADVFDYILSLSNDEKKSFSNYLKKLPIPVYILNTTFGGNTVSGMIENNTIDLPHYPAFPMIDFSTTSEEIRLLPEDISNNKNANGCALYKSQTINFSKYVDGEPNLESINLNFSFKMDSQDETNEEIGEIELVKGNYSLSNEIITNLNDNTVSLPNIFGNDTDTDFIVYKNFIIFNLQSTNLSNILDSTNPTQLKWNYSAYASQDMNNAQLEVYLRSRQYEEFIDYEVDYSNKTLKIYDLDEILGDGITEVQYEPLFAHDLTLEDFPLRLDLWKETYQITRRTTSAQITSPPTYESLEPVITYLDKDGDGVYETSVKEVTTIERTETTTNSSVIGCARLKYNLDTAEYEEDEFMPPTSINPYSNEDDGGTYYVLHTRVAPRDDIRKVLVNEDTDYEEELVEDRDFFVDYLTNTITIRKSLEEGDYITIRYTPNLTSNGLALAYKMKRPIYTSPTSDELSTDGEGYIHITDDVYLTTSYFTTRT